MVASKRSVATRSSRRTAAGGSNAEPNVYQQMLVEAGVSTPDQSATERPLKRRRPEPRQEANREAETVSSQEHPQPDAQESGEDGDEDIEFQDVIIPVPTVQTMELGSDDDDDDDDEDDDDEAVQFENVEFTAPLAEPGTSTEQNSHLELNLTAQKAATSPSKRHGERRRPISKEERERRIDIHKTHLVCLLSHVSRRNHWCNDARVQESLRPHLNEKTVNYLTPSPRLPQFGQAESLKNGLKQSVEMWKTKFVITERGIRRALWAEDVTQLQDYEPPTDMDSCLDRAEFREASKRLQGSRDVGAQLYCAMLRSVGVRARLVCSLQPLACVSSGPTLPRHNSAKAGSKTTTKQRAQEALAKYEALAASTSASRGSPSTSTARRRLGHPNATTYNFEPKSAPPRSQRTFNDPVRIRESAHPIYWVEVLDEGHQKWQPVDPVVTHSFWKPKVFEPPITDRENSLSYVVAFEADGTAKDVTRRYAKAYTAKSRKLRVETALNDNGEWWRKAMKPFGRRRATDLDQIEDNELAGVEAQEPMPKNVQDFKDHPVYALERHLRRHEVLAPEARPKQ